MGHIGYQGQERDDDDKKEMICSVANYDVENRTAGRTSFIHFDDLGGRTHVVAF